MPGIVSRVGRCRRRGERRRRRPVACQIYSPSKINVLKAKSLAAALSSFLQIGMRWPVAPWLCRPGVKGGVASAGRYGRGPSPAAPPKPRAAARPAFIAGAWHRKSLSAAARWRDDARRRSSCSSYAPFLGEICHADWHQASLASDWRLPNASSAWRRPAGKRHAVSSAITRFGGIIASARNRDIVEK